MGELYTWLLIGLYSALPTVKEVLRQIFIYAQLFWLMVIILAADFITGVYRAIKEKTFSLQKFPTAFVKFILYTVIYVDIKALCLIYEWLPDLDKIVMSLILMKEVISTLQNWKAVVGSGVFSDLAIQFLRLDVFHTVLQKTQSETTQFTCLESEVNKPQSQGDA